MNIPLAMSIDDTFVNWILGTLAVVIPSISATIVLLWRKFIAYITPKVTDAFASHKGLVDEMRSQVPIVSETLQKLGETQNKQCETLEQHSRLHEDHRAQLKEVLTELRKGKPPRRSENSTGGAQ